MNPTPTVLVAGGGEIMAPLEAGLSPERCRLVYIDSAAQALDRASDAGVVVIHERLPGALDLCRRLRADPVTAQVPLVLRSMRAIQVPATLADASVLANDVNGLLQMLEQYLPQPGYDGPVLNADDFWDEADEDNSAWDESEATVIWRRPTDELEAAQGWPPPPPTFTEGQDRVEFSLNFAGYMNSLIEALEDPSQLSADELRRLHEATHRTVGAAEHCVNQVQSWVNEALMAKDLTQMKLLSSAKNSLYDKLQRMRGMAAKLQETEPPPAASAGPPPTPAAPLSATSAPAHPERPSPPQTPPQTAPEPPREAPPQPGRADSSEFEALGLSPSLSKKSQITLAAEAKEAKEREAAHRAAKKAAEARKAARGSARRDAPSRLAGPTWLWVLLAVLAVGGSGAFITVTLLRGGTPKAKPRRANTAPVLERVSLQQTPAGIYARPQATDEDNDRISFAFTWFVNGAAVARAKTARLAPESFSAGDRVEVMVEPRDPYDKGAAMRSQALTVKSLARRPAPRRRPEPKPEEPGFPEP